MPDVVLPKEKLNPAIIFLLGSSFFWGATFLLIPEHTNGDRIAQIAASCVYALAIGWWCYGDAKAKSLYFPKWMVWLIVLTGPLGLLIHFFRTRDFLGALRAIGWSLGVLLMIMIAILIGALAAAFGPCQLDGISRYCVGIQ